MKHYGVGGRHEAPSDTCVFLSQHSVWCRGRKSLALIPSSLQCSDCSSESGLIDPGFTIFLLCSGLLDTIHPSSDFPGVAGVMGRETSPCDDTRMLDYGVGSEDILKYDSS